MPLDPSMQIVIDAIRGAGLPPLQSLDPLAARERASAMASSARGPGMLDVEEIRIEPAGREIGARLYRPNPSPLGMILYFHGGGWMLGGLDSNDALVRTLALRSECAALSVDYRLAPEHPFPAAVDDACSALNFVDAQIATLLGARVPLVVAGDSAGGNLAIAAAMHAREAGIDLAFQLLLYPVTDAGCDTASHAEHADAPILTHDLMQWFWSHYVPEQADRADPRASPLKARDFGGLPPALIQTAEIDPLRDEGEAYGRALLGAGVPVTIERQPGLVHGYAGMAPLVPAADRAITRAAEAVRAAVKPALCQTNPQTGSDRRPFPRS